MKSIDNDTKPTPPGPTSRSPTARALELFLYTLFSIDFTHFLRYLWSIRSAPKTTENWAAALYHPGAALYTHSGCIISQGLCYLITGAVSYDHRAPWPQYESWGEIGNTNYNFLADSWVLVCESDFCSVCTRSPLRILESNQ